MSHKKNNDSTFSYKFWENKPLEKLNFKEWEALCDGCGKCCLNKIEDEETGQVFLTRSHVVSSTMKVAYAVTTRNVINTFQNV